MAIEASFVATQGTFPLAEVFEKFPAAQIELDRVVPATQVLIPYFWLQDVDSEEIDLEGITHPGIDDLRIIDTVDDELFVRIDWNFNYESVLSAILETDVALVSAIGREDKWTFEIRGESQADVADFQTYCRDHDIPVELTELHALSPLRSGQEYDLTDAQREALTLAYARGYFDSPRQASQQDIAAELDITRQAFASRLQRGTRRLIASTLVRPSE
ncbi:HTH-10 family transcription regulator [Natrialba magadii ATCC 43099]|uniref:Bacterio-opsin activator HTH domain-containing protein n=1 Tax=Natrialba magadii (strain ATCC 43099 / DSM 3394 / CCM 3739 / CIP 104546 / IAM 13178 / JCM 8861 / NBRC 102185 / NCIMB 2190 / MS3) TaxID=547559 RepID=D3T060_NATMM|nr:helix-turn-helix domain-containing protein [Natrialba magadii]ADD04418.1 HTH-10 family transcription regulator [Natrialba magadii ATCC 43099]ELY25814.1 bacterio-opsin activator HTH domain-containing protein [Natrialba magadii ATCC 43099]